MDWVCPRTGASHKLLTFSMSWKDFEIHCSEDHVGELGRGWHMKAAPDGNWKGKVLTSAAPLTLIAWTSVCLPPTCMQDTHMHTHACRHTHADTHTHAQLLASPSPLCLSNSLPRHKLSFIPKLIQGEEKHYLLFLSQNEVWNLKKEQ